MLSCSYWHTLLKKTSEARLNLRFVADILTCTYTNYFRVKKACDVQPEQTEKEKGSASEVAGLSRLLYFNLDCMLKCFGFMHLSSIPTSIKYIQIYVLGMYLVLNSFNNLKVIWTFLDSLPTTAFFLISSLFSKVNTNILGSTE